MASLLAESLSHEARSSDPTASKKLDHTSDLVKRALELVDLTGQIPVETRSNVPSSSSTPECWVARMAILYNLGMISEVSLGPA